jgi:hypothetical protein
MIGLIVPPVIAVMELSFSSAPAAFDGLHFALWRKGFQFFGNYLMETVKR